MKKSEANFIDANKERFAAALAKASMSVRSNSRLIGLDKIREPLAFQAALRALNFEGALPGFAIPKTAGKPTQAMQDIVDEAFKAAVEAATPQPAAA